MKNTLIKFVALVAGVLTLSVSCQKEDLSCMDTTSLRVAVTPAPGTVAAIGGTFTSSVVVNQGNNMEVAWKVSVDNNPDWITVETTTVHSSFTGTYDGDDREYDVAGIKVNVQANTSGSKRTAYLRFTVDDGSSVTYAVNQSK